MFKKNAILFLCLSFCLFGSIGQLVKAETSIEEEVVNSALSEGDNAVLEVAADELEVEEPGTLSGWFGNIWRNVQAAFTRNKVKKAELELKKASSKLLQLEQWAEKESGDSQFQEKLEEMQTEYQELCNRIQERLEQAQSENPDDSRLKDFLAKYTSQQIRHQEILRRIEENVPSEVAQRIREKREEYLEKFSGVMAKLQNKEEIKTRIREELENQNIGEARRVRVMEIVENMAEKAPQKVKEQIQELKTERKDLFNEIKEMKEEIKENRQEFLQAAEEELKDQEEELENNPELQEQIITELKNEWQEIQQGNTEIQENIIQQRQEFKERIQERLGQ